MPSLPFGSGGTLGQRSPLGTANPSGVLPDLPARVTVNIALGGGPGGSSSGIVGTTTSPTAVLIVENKDFVFTGDRTLATDAACCGVSATGPYAEVIVRNCSFTGFRQGIVVTGGTGLVGKLRVVDSEIDDTLRHGISASKVTAVRVSRVHGNDCGATTSDHGVNIASDCGLTNSGVDTSIFINCGGKGVHMQPGGWMINNFVARCPTGLHMGGGAVPKAGGVTGTIVGNVIAEGEGFGVIEGNIVSCSTSFNMVYQNTGSAPNIGSLYLNGLNGGAPGVGVGLAYGANNRVLNWKWGAKLDGTVTTYSTTTWGSSLPLADNADVIVLNTVLGATWVADVLARTLLAPECCALVRAEAP